MAAGVVVAIAIIGYAVYQVHESSLPWQDKADKIHGIVDYRRTNPSIDTNVDENVTGTATYDTTPPAYGYGNPDWQRCEGDVYDAAIANENAIHSLALGAVWITYDPAKLDAAQVAQLATYVTGVNDVFMSPYPGQGSPISLQAWGFQLRLDDPADSRIAAFIADLKGSAEVESGDCTSGDYITATGTKPHSLSGPPLPTPSTSASPSASGSPPASG